jgi:hypothetical protein
MNAMRMMILIVSLAVVLYEVIMWLANSTS